MFTVKKLSNGIGLVLTAALALQVSVAQAVPFDPGLSVSGSVTLDTGFTVNGSGTLDATVGGSSHNLAYPGTVSINVAPGGISDINDGIGFTGQAYETASDLGPGEFAIGIDSIMSLVNTTVSSIFDVTFKLSYSNLVEAGGPDAFSDSELTLGSNGGFDDIFFSDLISDTLNGNEIGGNPAAGFGGELSEAGDLFFSFTLNPSDILDLEMVLTLEGGEFADGFAKADILAFLSIDQVDVRSTAVPLPGTFVLVGLGLILLPLQRRMRATMGK